MTATWVVVVLFWAMTVLVLSIARYIVPVMGLLFVLVPGLFQRRAQRSVQRTVEKETSSSIPAPA